MDRNRTFTVVDKENQYRREVVVAESPEQALEKSTINKKVETWGIPVDSCYTMEMTTREHRHQEIHTTLERPPQEPKEPEPPPKHEIPKGQRPF